ncbi:DNA repair protein RecO [Nesterenkonia alba]|uniref:DNA repair protein RecO n=1 Tax=Nesterenkonia alba TaxID=515814 RepID=UPI0003B781A0|nr:DNA repair protein RecO [Nesterenkonia alba]
MAGSTFASRSYRDIAVILRTQKLGEADRIITCLTAFHGLVRAVAKGVRRTSSKFGATLEPFMVADVQFVHGRSLDIVTQATGRSAYGPMIVSDYEKYTAASAMAEAAERLTEGASIDRAQFDLIHGGYSALAHGRYGTDLILASYLLRAMATAGWQVTWTRCVGCAEPGAHSSFHPAAGGPVCPACRPPGSRTLSAGAVPLLHALQHGQWHQTTECTADLRHEAVEVVTGFAQHHLERPFKALAAAH